MSSTGFGSTSTIVGTKLFDQTHTGVNGWAPAASIATQWGHVFSSTHFGMCTDAEGSGGVAQWDMDPFSKRAVRR